MDLGFWIGIGVAVFGIGLSIAKVEHRPTGIGLSVVGVGIITWALISKPQSTKREPPGPKPSLPTSSPVSRSPAATGLYRTRIRTPAITPTPTPDGLAIINKFLDERTVVYVAPM